MTGMTLQRSVAMFVACCLALGVAHAEGRSDEDRARNAQRKPTQVLEFLGVEAGDTVLDIWASGGWYTEVLSEAVGPGGRVYSQNPPGVLAWRDGYYDNALSERLAGNRLGNVVRIDQAMSDGPIDAGSVDVALTALNLHDIYNGDGEDAAVAVLAAVLSVLKPGGVLGVVDHIGVAGADNAALHRMQPEQARAAAIAAGFVIEAESDVLANPEDDHAKMVFDPGIRGNTDRFILRLKKTE